MIRTQWERPIKYKIIQRIGNQFVCLSRKMDIPKKMPPTLTINHDINR